MFKRYAAVAAATLSLLLFFQNCDGNFKVQTPDESGNSALGIDIAITNERLAYNSSNTELSFEAKNISAAQIKSIVCSWDSDVQFDCSTKKVSLQSLVDGDHTLNVSIETISNPSIQATKLVRIDKSAPNISFLVFPSAASNISSGSITFLAVDSLSGLNKIECSLDSATYQVCASPFEYKSLAEGNHTLKVRAYDRADNMKESTVLSWKINTTLPTITITKSPNAVTNQDSASFEFNGTNTTRFECNFNNQGYSACTSPKAYTGLTHGSYSFSARAYSESGNVSQPAEKVWTVDKTVPTISLSGMPSANTNQTSATFTFSGAQVKIFECSLDNSTYSECVSAKVYSSLSSGSHTFKLRGVNAAGTYSVESSYTWTIDTAVPTVTISQNPAAVTNQTSASFTFSGSGIVSYQCSLDSGTFAACSSAKVYTGLAEGNHSFQVKGTNAAQVTSSAAIYNWKIELTKPTVTLTSKPDANSSSSTATFQFSSSNADKYECQLGTGALQTCTSTKTYTGLADAEYDFKVRATSAAGNISDFVTYHWSVNSTPPTLSIASVPAAFSQVNPATISFSGANATKFECKVADGSFATCSSPYSVSQAVEGTQNIRVRAVSSSGLLSAESLVSWVYDKTAPSAAQIVLDVTNPTTKTSVSINFTASDTNGIDRFTCSIDGTQASVCTSPKSYSDLAIANHTFTVTAYDKAGNSSSASTSWKVDEPSLNLLPEYKLGKFSSAQTGLLTPVYLSGAPGSGFGYAYSACGVFKISNNGSTLEKKLYKVPGKIYSVAEANGKIWVGTPLGLFVSTDNGATFSNRLDASKVTTLLATQTDKPYPCGTISYNRFAVNEVYATANLLIARNSGTLFISQDNGATFYISRFYRDEGQINPPFTVGSMSVNGSEIIIGSTEYPAPTTYALKPPATSCASINQSSNPSGIFISKDSGKTFNLVNGAGDGHRSVFRSAAQPNVLMSFRTAAVQQGSRTAYRSSDNGATFTKLTDTNLVGTGGELDANNVRNMFSEVPGALFLSRYRDYSTGSQFLKSVDNGANWSNVTIDPRLPASELGSSNALALSATDLAVATNNGVYISNNAGNTFTKVHKFDSNFCAYPWWTADSWG